jgi:hypothetical protein
MKQGFLAAFALLACGTAAGQSGGIILIGGPGPGTVVANPVGFTPIDIGPFEPVYFEQSSHVFIIADFSAMSGDAMRQADQRDDLVFDPSLQGEPVLMTVEGDGVRLPDQRLDTAKP